MFHTSVGGRVKEKVNATADDIGYWTVQGEQVYVFTQQIVQEYTTTYAEVDTPDIP